MKFWENCSIITTEEFEKIFNLDIEYQVRVLIKKNLNFWKFRKEFISLIKEKENEK